jgi:hypothetical protein
LATRFFYQPSHGYVFRQALWVAALQAAKKLKALSFRGMPFAEESLILLTLKPGEIPRFARNDTKKYFLPSLHSRFVLAIENRGYPGFEEFLRRRARETN